MAVKKETEDEASPNGSTPRPTPSPPKQALFSSSVAVLTQCGSGSGSKEEQKREKEAEEEEEEDEEEEDHFRHRRLTGDSGIEVCRCHVKREEQEVELQKGHLARGGKEKARADVLHDSMDCSLRAKSSGLSPLLDDSVSSASSGVIQKTGEAIITMESL